jgi:cytoskeletal protein CcmA (bactofilin family)
MWFARRRQPLIRHLVCEDSVVHGELRFVDRLRSDREVHGDVLAAGGANSLLDVSEKALMHGKVKAGHVIINGKVLGPNQFNDRLELQSKSCVDGDARFGLLKVHRGTGIGGEVGSLKSGESPTVKLPASNNQRLQVVMPIDHSPCPNEEMP